MAATDFGFAPSNMASAFLSSFFSDQPTPLGVLAAEIRSLSTLTTTDQTAGVKEETIAKIKSLKEALLAQKIVLVKSYDEAGALYDLVSVNQGWDVAALYVEEDKADASEKEQGKKAIELLSKQFVDESRFKVLKVMGSVLDALRAPENMFLEALFPSSEVAAAASAASSDVVVERFRSMIASDIGGGLRASMERFLAGREMRGVQERRADLEEGGSQLSLAPPPPPEED